MKSFYSLIKISPNEMSGDSLTIGILLSSPNGLKVRFSRARKQFARSIIALDASIIDFIENEILSRVNEHNKSIANNKLGLPELPYLLDSDYFIYLSKYSNGLLKFTAPNTIVYDVDDIKFEKLYRMFVDNNHEPEKKTKENNSLFFEQVNNKLISRVKDKVHTNFDIDSKVVPSLNNAFLIDCIGLNGVFVGAKAIPFTQTKDTLSKVVNTYISIIAQLSSKYNKSINDNKFFLIADQPTKRGPVNDLWQRLYKEEKLLKVISSKECDEVAEVIEENNASTFIL